MHSQLMIAELCYYSNH